MTTPQQLEERLVALEIKASFSEDALDQLDAVIARQQRQIDSLCQQLASLQAAATAADAPLNRNPRDELPPHY